SCLFINSFVYIFIYRTAGFPDLSFFPTRRSSDLRQRVLTATPPACSALAEVRADHAGRLRSALAGLTQDEIQTASKVFRLLSERSEEHTSELQSRETLVCRLLHEQKNRCFDQLDQ